MIRRIAAAVVTVVMLGLIITRYPYGRSDGISGRWIKKIGATSLPDRMTIQQAGNAIVVRYFEDGGLVTMSLLCDGKEHRFSKYVYETTYRANCDRNHLELTKFVSYAPQGIAERWSLSEDGSGLVIERGETATYARRSLLDMALVGTP